ncbi:hypothetical protein GCWU000324_02581 [Kingella oralis ATCC 51147]|uniref:Uncharacterized protein n=1 Tax=Kingella oralis ATCC 51147 TaxID=629741 RepID=C4GLL0_9NEIS|nr:hypothetical protein GCWU000324_02581 [Kingella oralis ATCC 51147]
MNLHINLYVIITPFNHEKNRFILWLDRILGVVYLRCVHLFSTLCRRKNYLCLPTRRCNRNSNLVDIIA